MIAKMFGIKKGDVVSITGSSGKTSLMFKLSSELRGYKTLVTTTTNIYMPKEDTYDFMYIGRVINVKPGITVYAEHTTPEGKLAVSGGDTLSNTARLFDYTFIESDGSRGKPLKAWSEYEPVIANATTKTIGIINVKYIGSEISADFIHRLEIFKRNFSGSDNILSLSHLVKAITHRDGLFKNSKGELILFINQVESETELENSKKLVSLLGRESSLHYKTIYGSIKNNYYESLSKE